MEKHYRSMGMMLMSAANILKSIADGKIPITDPALKELSQQIRNYLTQNGFPEPNKAAKGYYWADYFGEES